MTGANAPDVSRETATRRGVSARQGSRPGSGISDGSVGGGSGLDPREIHCRLALGPNAVPPPAAAAAAAIGRVGNGGPGVELGGQVTAMRPVFLPREGGEALPDILNSHLLPPYTGPRQNQRRPRQGRGARGQGGAQDIARRGVRPFAASSRHQQHGSSNQPSPVTTLDDEGEKECCSRESCVACLTGFTRFKWVLVSLALLGICCVVTGIVLGALHMSIGSSFLTLSLMFIGLGVMLVVVVGIGWRCTPPGHEPCHLLFGLGSHSTRRRRSSRHRRDRHHWMGGVLYPEFRHRRPPPSYNASMQDYQQQVMMAQTQRNPEGDDYSLPSSPPPTYRSRVSTIRPGLHITFPPQSGGEYPSSGPPTYRSHVSDVNDGHRPALDLEGAVGGAVGGSRSGLDSLERALPGPSSGLTRAYRTRAEGKGSYTTPSDTASSSSTLRHVGGAGAGAETPLSASASSTLHRAQQVVQYLDRVICDQSPLYPGTDTVVASISRGVQVSGSPSREGSPETSVASPPRGPTRGTEPRPAKQGKPSSRRSATLPSGGGRGGGKDAGPDPESSL